MKTIINVVKTEDQPAYCVQADKTASEDKAIEKALKILESRLRKPGSALTSPETTKTYLRFKLAELEHEVFSVIFLNNQHQVIEYRELFRGTIDGASVYPREVLKACLQLNAAAVIFAHNHPSGINEPSSADRNITDKLKAALNMVDIRTLDHLIIGSGDPYSFAEHGLI